MKFPHPLALMRCQPLTLLSRKSPGLSWPDLNEKGSLSRRAKGPWELFLLLFPDNSVQLLTGISFFPRRCGEQMVKNEHMRPEINLMIDLWDDLIWRFMLFSAPIKQLPLLTAVFPEYRGELWKLLITRPSPQPWKAFRWAAWQSWLKVFIFQSRRKNPY